MFSIRTGDKTYPVCFGRGLLARVGEFFDLSRRVMVVTDDGVPKEYAAAVLAAAEKGFLYTVPQGEASKSLSNYGAILGEMLRLGFDRGDCVVAVGGGVVGDLAGFVAATYMRGVAFCNVPTTTLSQVDSSVGGKTAIDLLGYKNSIGAFYPPQAVLIDPDTLKTLPPRQFAAGMAEAIKMAACFDRPLFDRFAARRDGDDPAPLIHDAILIKKRVVEEDEKEKDLRRVLNFGHTLGHALETQHGLTLLHGEAVSVGMPPFCGKKAREELEEVLARFGLPVTLGPWWIDAVLESVRHDKKKHLDSVTVVTVPEIGRFEFRDLTFEDLRALLEKENER